MTTAKEIVTGILIGGKSTRMGTDKALLPWNDTTILETIVRTARQVSEEVVLLGTAANLPDSLRDMTVLPDPYPDAGPIAGLCALLRHAPENRSLLLSCDIPNMTAEVLQTLINQATPDTQVVAYTTEAPVAERNTPATPPAIQCFIHSCSALYDPALLPTVETALAADRLSLNKLITSVPHALIPAAQHALHNINLPSDYPGCPS